ncbi:MAG: BT4734/BF3469 family protein [Verrucomicrobiota bacterium]
MIVEISLSSATSSDITGTTTPEDLIRDIKRGRWAKEIKALRAATGANAAKLKKNLPGVLWAGKFTTRNNSGIDRFSDCLCADIDKVAARIGELHATAQNDPHVLAAFVSPSGTGFKIIFRVAVATDAKQYQHCFNAVRAHVRKHYGAKVDEQAKDVARLCFVSHDPKAFYNEAAVALPISDNTSSALNTAYCMPASLDTCVSASSASLHNNADTILANIAASIESHKILAAKHPQLAMLYAELIEPRFQAAAHARNQFIVQSVPFLYRAIAAKFVIELVGCFYDCNRSIFNDTRTKHLKEAAAMLKSVSKTYAESLNKGERKIYDTLTEPERDTFRICRDLAMLKTPARAPQTFFLSFNHLGDRLGIFPMQAQRIMWQLENYGLIKLLKKGTRRAAGIRGEAGTYQWQLPL